MVNPKWVDLAKLADLAYQIEAQKLAKLSAMEGDIVGRRNKLEAMNEAALDAFATVHPAHRHDGDFQWQTWVGKNAQALGYEQAKVRALAEIQKPELRKAFGRKSVLSKLLSQKTR